MYDIIIIGTGAGGGTLLSQLAPSGKRILVLERGDFLPREKENWDPLLVAQGRYKTTEMWLDRDGKPFSPYQHYWVGGNTKLYGGALLRLREQDFRATPHFDGLSPEWPLSYADFELWYSRAEQLYAVHGARGIDPTEPPASEAYPFPPLPFEPRMEVVANSIRRQGYHPTPIPLAIRLPEDQPRPGEINRPELYDGYPDPTEAKADAHVVGIKAALQYPNVSLLTGRKAIKILTHKTGRRATAVVTELADGSTETFEGETIVLSAGAINSAVLLLRSANKSHPQGLANSSGMVGRNLMLHNNGIVLAYSATPNPSRFQKAILIPDFYFGADNSPYPLGSIQNMGKADPLLLADAVGDDLGRDGKDAAHFAEHTIDFFITAEDLPHPDNRIRVTPNGQIQLEYTPNNLEAYRRLREKLITIMDSVADNEGVGDSTRYYGFKLGIGGVSHQTGTCRFGHDPHTSVLDPNCKAHDLDNLYVVDTSFFPSSGAVNPSLTVMANALRVGKLLLSLLLIFLAFSVGAQKATRVAAVSITVCDLDREVAFFEQVLDFKKTHDEIVTGEAVQLLYGLPDNSREVRIATLQLGAEQIRLLDFDPTVRVAPSQQQTLNEQTRGNDRWFQHLAIVVSDMDSAYQRLLHHKVTHVSTAPQTLPDYLPNAAGIRAFYFRDPEGHNLELIWFPAGKGDPKWKKAGAGSWFLGIDHTAISIADTDASMAFYRDLLGLTHGGHSENYGPEQEHLNQVFGARLDINGLHAAAGFGVEFLRYIAPPGGRAYPADSKPTDLWHYQTEFIVEHLDGVAPKLKAAGSTPISAGKVSIAGGEQWLWRDPDGHAVLLKTSN